LMWRKDLLAKRSVAAKGNSNTGDFSVRLLPQGSDLGHRSDFLRSPRRVG
jgi:hypothetical protein